MNENKTTNKGITSMDSNITQEEELKQENLEKNNIPITNHDSLHKYRTELPNMVLDLGLDPYELSLYTHLKRIAGDRGACFTSNKTLIKKTKMKLTKLNGCKKSLAEKGLIKLTVRKKDDGSFLPTLIEIVDLWPENFEHFKNISSMSPQNEGVFSQNRGISSSDSKEEPYKKEPYKKEVASCDALFLSKYLFSKLREKNSKYKEPNLKQWAKEIGLMMRGDQRTKEEILSVLDWAFKQTDDFWPTAIQSPKTLRKLFDSAWLKKNHHLQKEGLKEELRGKNLTWIKNKIEDLTRIGARGNLRYDETEVFDDVLGVRTSLTAAKMVDIVKEWDKMRFKR